MKQFYNNERPHSTKYQMPTRTMLLYTCTMLSRLMNLDYSKGFQAQMKKSMAPKRRTGSNDSLHNTILHNNTRPLHLIHPCVILVSSLLDLLVTGPRASPVIVLALQEKNFNCGSLRGAPRPQRSTIEILVLRVLMAQDQCTHSHPALVADLSKTCRRLVEVHAHPHTPTHTQTHTHTHRHTHPHTHTYTYTHTPHVCARTWTHDRGATYPPRDIVDAGFEPFRWRLSCCKQARTHTCATSG